MHVCIVIRNILLKVWYGLLPHGGWRQSRLNQEAHITNAGQRIDGAAGEIAHAPPSVSELIQEHKSEIGVITLLCSTTKFPIHVCVCASEWAGVCEGWQVNENVRQQISKLILRRLFIYSFEKSWSSSLFHFHAWYSLEEWCLLQPCSLHCSLLFLWTTTT